MSPRSMAGRFLTVAAAAALLLFAVSQASGGFSRTKQGCSARPNSSLHWNAVFGHVTSLWQGVLQKRRIQGSGFTGIQFEKDYCDDIELAVPGADTPAVRGELVKEATASHLSISFEPPDILKRSQPEIWKAIFGSRPTLSRANKLQSDIADVGFHEGSDIERIALHAWRVVVYNIPTSSQDDFAAEARSVGYRVTFVPQ
jgi:hypothetical protein